MRGCSWIHEDIVSLITVGNATNSAVVLCVHLQDDEMPIVVTIRRKVALGECKSRIQLQDVDLAP